MNHWIYFATAEKASAQSTVDTVINTEFLWRSAFNRRGARIANVSAIRPGDRIVLAWRYSAAVQTAYLDCIVAAPVSPISGGLVIDRLADRDADELIAAGYPSNAVNEIEGIRLDNIRESYFNVKGKYGGNNAIHKLADEDLRELATAPTIPAGEFIRTTSSRRVQRSASHRQLQVSDAIVKQPDIDDVRLDDLADDRAFDAYVMVDWSSSSTPATGKDSIWIGMGAWASGTFTAGPPCNVPTRVEAIDIVRKHLLAWRGEGKRVLVGFDFAFGYPAGFACALGLAPHVSAWKAIHQHLAARVEDSPDNRHNRDSFADECNRKIGAPGPFWGCTSSGATPALTQQRLGIFKFPHHGLDEWRATDRVARCQATTQSVWKLNCGVSVGGQTILGIKHLHDLSHSVNGHCWPFDGWNTPGRAAIWFAEIFPSLVNYPEWGGAYKAERDRTQVQSCIRQAAERDAAGLLRQDFARPETLDASTLAKVEQEEGWILWVGLNRASSTGGDLRRETGRSAV